MAASSDAFVSLRLDVFVLAGRYESLRPSISAVRVQKCAGRTAR